MEWMTEPLDFRAQLKAALALPEGGERLLGLASLATSRLTPLQTIQIDNALRAVPSGSDGGLIRRRVAIIGSSTCEHLLPAVRVGGLRHGLLIETYVGSYGQYRQELLDRESGLWRFAPETVLLALRARDLLGGVPLDATRTTVNAVVGRAVDDLRGFWQAVSGGLHAGVVQQTFLDIEPSLFGNYDAMVPGSPGALIARLNLAVADAAADAGVLLLDVARASARDGYERWFDIGRWLQGKIEIAPQAAPAFGEMLARVIAAGLGRSRKCLVLDLDNTLWGGVVGDDGVEGIVLGQGSAAGEAHLELQRYALQLKQRGVILAVCSKNDPRIAEAAFDGHPEMMLKRPDIACFVANWEDKARNLCTIAERLNIGLDSLVFVDDNPAERARVRSSLPTVAVPELPADPALYVAAIANAGYFEAAAFTKEDQERAGLYLANAERDRLRETVSSLDDYLRELQMTVVHGQVESVDQPRVVQLFNKTNQFNTTNRRFGAEEFAALVAHPGSLALRYRLLDRFGDNGIVSALLLAADDEDSGVMHILNWVMSCRVFGRQLEDEIMNLLVERARACGVRELHANFVETARNGVVSGLYERLGFAPLATSGAGESGQSLWRLRLDDYVRRQTSIACQEQ